jgi:hypothetical protein
MPTPPVFLSRKTQGSLLLQQTPTAGHDGDEQADDDQTVNVFHFLTPFAEADSKALHLSNA